MSSIVIAFPKQEVAQGIKKILSQSGYRVAQVCHSGAAAINAMQQTEDAILVCGARFPDMMYTEIIDCIGDSSHTILVASQVIMEDKPRDLMALSLPLKVHELLETLRMMDESLARRRRKLRQQPKVRSEEDQNLIKDAKRLLMERNQMSEEDAHRYMQKRSMDNGTGLVETAQMIMALNSN